jgi:hypothetical protein
VRAVDLQKFLSRRVDQVHHQINALLPHHGFQIRSVLEVDLITSAIGGRRCDRSWVDLAEENWSLNAQETDTE